MNNLKKLVASVKPDKESQEFDERQRKAYERDMKAQYWAQQKKDEEYQKYKKIHDAKEKTLSDDGNEWTANMPLKYQNN